MSSSRQPHVPGRGRRSRRGAYAVPSASANIHGLGSHVERLIQLATRLVDDVEDIMHDHGNDAGVQSDGEDDDDSSSSSESSGEEEDRAAGRIDQAAEVPASEHRVEVAVQTIQPQGLSAPARPASAAPRRRQTNFERDFERSLMPPPRSIPARSTSAQRPAAGPSSALVVHRGASSNTRSASRHSNHTAAVTASTNSAPLPSLITHTLRTLTSPPPPPAAAPARRPPITRQYAFYDRLRPEVFWLDEWDENMPDMPSFDVSMVPRDLSARAMLRMMRELDGTAFRAALMELREQEIAEEQAALARARRADTAAASRARAHVPAAARVESPPRTPRGAEGSASAPPAEPPRGRGLRRRGAGGEDESPTLSLTTRKRGRDSGRGVSANPRPTTRRRRAASASPAAEDPSCVAGPSSEAVVTSGSAGAPASGSGGTLVSRADARPSLPTDADGDGGSRIMPADDGFARLPSPVGSPTSLQAHTGNSSEASTSRSSSGKRSRTDDDDDDEGGPPTKRRL